MTITESNNKHGFTKYENSRYIETTDRSVLAIMNSFIDESANINSFDGKLGEFDLEIKTKRIKGVNTKVISGEYKGIYFEQFIA